MPTEASEQLGPETVNLIINNNYYFAPGSQNAIAMDRGQVSNNVFGGGAQVGDEPKGPRPKVKLLAEDKGQLLDNKFYGTDADAHAKGEGVIAKQEVRDEAPPPPAPEEKTRWFRDPKWMVPLVVALIAAVATITAAVINSSKTEPPAATPVSPSGSTTPHGTNKSDGAAPLTPPVEKGESP